MVRTDTPIGALLDTSADNLKLLGGAGGLRHYAQEDEQARSSLPGLRSPPQKRHTELCTRGGLKSAHQAFVFLEEIAAVEVKLTHVALYTVLHKELLSSTLSGGSHRQAPRIPTVMVQALDDMVVGGAVRFYFRVSVWWLLQQCWGTLRFSDHRGLVPDEKFDVKGNSLSTRLTRSKTIGSDKTVSSRSVVVSPTCYVKRADWLSTGWTLLKQHADYPRDYLLPMPSGNYKGGAQRELRYDTAHALQTSLSV